MKIKNMEYFKLYLKINISEIQKSLEIFGYDKSCVEFFFEEQILETGGGILRIYHELSLRNKKNQFNMFICRM